MGNAKRETRNAKCKIACHANAKCAKSHMTKAKRERPFSATVMKGFVGSMVYHENASPSYNKNSSTFKKGNMGMANIHKSKGDKIGMAWS